MAANSNRERFLSAAFTALQLLAAATMAFVALHPERFLSPVQASRLIVYFVLPTLLIASLQWARRRPLSTRINVVLSLASTLACLYAVELLLASGIVKPRIEKIRTTTELAKETNTPFDHRPLGDVVTEYRKKGVRAYPNGSGVDFVDTDGLPGESGRIFPLGWISRQFIVYCNESGRYAEFTTDEHGFRNPLGLYAGGKLDLLLVGDSFTEGACVPDGKDLGSLLRARFPRTLNLGKASNGPHMQLATLREYGVALKPRVVLWMVYENDLRNIGEQRRSAFLTRYLEDPGFSQGLLERQREIDSAIRAFVDAEYAKREDALKQPAAAAPQEIPERFSAYNFLKLTALRQLLKISAYEQPPPGQRRIELAEFLSKASSLVSGWGGKLYVVYLPSWFRKQGRPTMADTNSAHPVVSEAVQKIGIPFVDLYPVFRDHPDPEALFPFRTNAHYAEQGYALVAEQVLARLAQDLSANEASPERPRR